MPIPKEFSMKFKSFRKKAGLTQRALAKMVGVSHTYISKIENNKLEHPPSISTICNMAEAMGIDSAELLRVSQKLPPYFDPIMSDTDALHFMQQASGMISSKEGWREMQRILEEMVEKGEIE